jgi:intein/homing endonuclease
MANNVDVARLVGHAFGDGSIHNKKHYFVYTNSNETLQKRVRAVVRRVFGNVKYNIGTSVGGTPRYQYSNACGKFLSQHGAPVGAKIRQPARVPRWITSGEEGVKIAFVSALFDDEGGFRDSSDAAQIVFKSAKTVELKKDLVRYLSQIRKILRSLGIRTSEIRPDQEKTKKDGTKIVSLRFWITGRENFRRFRKKIILFHPQKRMKLLRMTPIG